MNEHTIYSICGLLISREEMQIMLTLYMVAINII